MSGLGLRHAVIGYHDSDIAGVLENTGYLELLRRGWSVCIGKQDMKEVDFVADRADERLYIQVCYVLTPENMDREFAPLEAIADYYEKLVLSTDTLLKVNRGGMRSDICRLRCSMSAANMRWWSKRSSVRVRHRRTMPHCGNTEFPVRNSTGLPAGP